MPKNEPDRKFKEGSLVAINIMPIPKGNSIVAYCHKINETKSFAFKLARKKIIELFLFYNVSESFYKNRRGEFRSRVENIFRPIYFAIVKSDLHGSPARKFETMLNLLLNKIDKEMNYDNN